MVWEDVEDAGAGAAKQEGRQSEDFLTGSGGVGGDDHWRARAAVRQRFWSTSHGFAMGRKLGDWERHAGAVVVECAFVLSPHTFGKAFGAPLVGLPWGDSWGTGSGMQVWLWFNVSLHAFEARLITHCHGFVRLRQKLGERGLLAAFFCFPTYVQLDFLFSESMYFWLTNEYKLWSGNSCIRKEKMILQADSDFERPP